MKGCYYKKPVSESFIEAGTFASGSAILGVVTYSTALIANYMLTKGGIIESSPMWILTCGGGAATAYCAGHALDSFLEGCSNRYENKKVVKSVRSLNSFGQDNHFESKLKRRF